MRNYLCVAVLGSIVLASGCVYRAPFSIISANSGKCVSLEPAGGYYDGDPVQQWDCSHYHTGLQSAWEFAAVPQQSDTYQLISIHSGKCMEVNPANGGKNNGDAVQQAKCTGGNNQKWTLVGGAGGIHTITSMNSGKCLEVKMGPTGGMQDGDPLQQWDCNGGKNQTWSRQGISAPRPPLDTGTGQLCNVCNPAKPDCAGGAKCIVLPSSQSVCGQSCGTSSACPEGYTCSKIAQLGQTVFQCVPADNECP